MGVLNLKSIEWGVLYFGKKSIERAFRVRVLGRPGRTIFQVIPEKLLQDAWFSTRCMIEAVLNDCRVDLVIDVGANRGQFVRRMRDMFNGPIISFEPVQSLFSEIAQASRLETQWFVVNYALGNETGNKTMNVYEASEFSSLFSTNDFCARRFGSRTVEKTEQTVQIRRLDDLWPELPIDLTDKRILLKMDTQGYDLEVFKGAARTLKNVVAVVSEVSHAAIYDGMPHWLETIAAFEKEGFRLVSLCPISRDGLRFIESDCIMVRALGEPSS